MGTTVKGMKLLKVETVGYLGINSISISGRALIWYLASQRVVLCQFKLRILIV